MVVGKIFNNDHGPPERVRAAFNKSMEEFQLDYLDYYLMHWPISFTPGPMAQPMRDPFGTPHPDLQSRTEYLETWASMTTLLGASCKHIGVSNFTVSQIVQITQDSGIKPAVNQIELHPYLGQSAMLDYCKQHGIQIMAYAPLGSPGGGGADDLLVHPTVQSIAKAHHASPAQVLLQWGMQRGAVVIPKSISDSRIVENFQAQELELTSAEVEAVDALEVGHRYYMGFTPENFVDEWCQVRGLSELPEFNVPTAS